MNCHFGKASISLCLHINDDDDDDDDEEDDNEERRRESLVSPFDSQCMCFSTDEVVVVNHADPTTDRPTKHTQALAGGHTHTHHSF